MNSSEFSRITDELLSAYIDNAVTAQERTLVEAASAADTEIAWRLASLRQTVALLHDLPELPLPRSFVLQESQVVEAALLGGRVPRSAPANVSLLDRISTGWRSFWQAGNPVLRNAAAAAFVLLLVLLGGDALLGDLAGGTQLMAPAPNEAAMSEAVISDAAAPAEFAAVAPASAELSPAVESAEAPAAEEGAEMAAEADAGAEAVAMQSFAVTEAPQTEPAEAETATAAGAALEPQAAPQPEAALASQPAEEEPSAAAAMAVPAPSGMALSPETEAAEEAMILGELGIVSQDGLGGGPPTAREAGAPAAPAARMLAPQAPADTQESLPVEGEAFAGGAIATEPPALAAKTAAEPTSPEESAATVEQPAPEAPAAEVAIAETAEQQAAIPAVTATPLPTVTAHALFVAESPLQEPYPAPSAAFSGWSGLPALVQWVQLALALTVFVLGVMWWRSRSVGAPPGSAE